MSKATVPAPRETTDAAVSASPAADRTSRARVGIVAVVVLIGTLAGAALGAWHPAPDVGDTFSYGLIQPIRDTWWAYHFFGGMAVAAGAVALGIATCLLARSRGAAWANIGAVLTALGGVAFGVAIAAEGAVFAYATDPAALPTDAGTTLMTYANAHPDRWVAGILPGLLFSALGSIAIWVALWRARSVPKWVPIAYTLGGFASIFAPFGPVNILVGLPNAIGAVAIGWYAWRRAGASRSAVSL